VARASIHFDNFQTGSVSQQLRLLRSGRTAVHRRCEQSRRPSTRTSTYYRHPQPRQPELAHNTRHHCCITRTRKVSVRATSIEPPPARQGRQGINQYLHSVADRAGLAHQQRDRLEDRVLRPSRAVQRCDLPGEVDQRAGRLLRPRTVRQSDLRHQCQNFRVRGIETQIVARATQGLT